MISIFDPHSLFSIVESHITQHLSNINVNDTLSKILQIDEIGSSVNDSISLSLSTQPTGETPLSSLCIVKCENSKEYNVVRGIIKSWLKRTGNEYYVILCLTGFGVRIKKSSFYTKMCKDFQFEVAGDSTSLVNARALSQQTCAADLSDVVSKLVRSVSRRCVDMCRKHELSLERLSATSSIRECLEVRKSRSKLFESIGLYVIAIDELDQIARLVVSHQCDHTVFNKDEDLRDVDSEISVRDVDETLPTSNLRLDIYLFLLRRRLLLKDYERCCLSGKLSTASLRVAKMARICHSLLRRVAACPDREKWILTTARLHISFCETCYAKAPSKDLASQIAYLYLFVADHEREEHDRDVSLALKMFEAADMKRMCAFLRRDVSLLSWSGEKCSKEESDDDDKSNDYEVSLFASVLCVSKNFVQCSIESKKKTRCHVFRVHLVSKSLDLSVPPTGQIDEIEVPGLVTFRIQNQDDFLTNELPEDLSLDMHVLNHQAVSLPLPLLSLASRRSSNIVKSFRVHFSSHKSNDTCLLFEGTVSMVGDESDPSSYCYEVHYDEKHWLPRSSSLLRSMLKFEHGCATFSFSMTPLNHALSFHNVPRVSILNSDFCEVACTVSVMSVKNEEKKKK